MSKKTEQDSGQEQPETEVDQATVDDAEIEGAGKEAIDIDGEIVDAEVTEVTEREAPPAKEKSSSKVSVMAILLALVALIATAAGLGLGYQHWKNLQADLQEMNTALAQAVKHQSELQQRIDTTNQAFDAQKQQLESQRQALSSQDEKLAAERAKLEKQGSEMQQTLESVYQRVGRNSTAWMASEAEYLLQVANHRLRLENDPATAIKALEAADARLRDSGDPGWIGVRESIAAEIAKIKAVGSLDRAGLSAKLIGMAKQVDGLKVFGTEPMPAEERKAAEISEEQGRSLETLVRDGWEGFKSIMVIRHHGKPVTAMMPPDQQFFVQQNLRLKFESARMAMLRADQPLYQASLEIARQWLNDFFETDNSAAQALLVQINELEAVNVQPDLPDISASLLALRERMKQSAAGEAGQ
ncbi:MAG: HemX protein [Sedimenticola sp.]|nr:MAG: HemX protein [Sedimenticola sp.]